jgi:hypothetical protein
VASRLFIEGKYTFFYGVIIGRALTFSGIFLRSRSFKGYKFPRVLCAFTMNTSELNTELLLAAGKEGGI